jgi:hypothetical protein
MPLVGVVDTNEHLCATFDPATAASQSWFGLSEQGAGIDLGVAGDHWPTTGAGGAENVER